MLLSSLKKAPLHLAIEKTKRMVEFNVTDNGIGISPNHKTMSFWRLRQAQNISHASYGGTGLGLTISKGLVHLIGGKIKVKSNQGSGATFNFTHPYSADGSNKKHT